MIPVLVVLCFLIFVYKQPDILISSKVDLVAVRSDNGSLWLSTKSKERYTADQWMRASGLADQEKIKWPREGRTQDFPLVCDAIGCRGDIKGHKVAVAFAQEAWREDCPWADIVISKTPVPYKECAARRIIDFFDVWREGAHAIWLAPDRVKIRSVEGERGDRPWAQIASNKK
jgi:competence protein ComEC